MTGQHVKQIGKIKIVVISFIVAVSAIFIGIMVSNSLQNAFANDEAIEVAEVEAVANEAKTYDQINQEFTDFDQAVEEFASYITNKDYFEELDQDIANYIASAPDPASLEAELEDIDSDFAELQEEYVEFIKTLPALQKTLKDDVLSAKILTSEFQKEYSSLNAQVQNMMDKNALLMEEVAKSKELSKTQMDILRKLSEQFIKKMTELWNTKFNVEINVLSAQLEQIQNDIKESEAAGVIDAAQAKDLTAKLDDYGKKWKEKSSKLMEEGIKAVSARTDEKGLSELQKRMVKIRDCVEKIEKITMKSQEFNMMCKEQMKNLKTSLQEVVSRKDYQEVAAFEGQILSDLNNEAKKIETLGAPFYNEYLPVVNAFDELITKIENTASEDNLFVDEVINVHCPEFLNKIDQFKDLVEQLKNLGNKATTLEDFNAKQAELLAEIAALQADIENDIAGLAQVEIDSKEISERLGELPSEIAKFAASGFIEATAAFIQEIPVARQLYKDLTDAVNKQYPQQANREVALLNEINTVGVEPLQTLADLWGEAVVNVGEGFVDRIDAVVIPEVPEELVPALEEASAQAAALYAEAEAVAYVAPEAVAYAASDTIAQTGDNSLWMAVMVAMCMFAAAGFGISRSRKQN